MKLDSKKMVLIKTKCQREGYDSYWDLLLVWKHEGRIYSTRVRPCFGKDNKILIARAVECLPGEPFDKYL